LEFKYDTPYFQTKKPNLQWTAVHTHTSPWWASVTEFDIKRAGSAGRTWRGNWLL